MLRNLRDLLSWLNALRQNEGWRAMVQNLTYYIARHIYIKEHYWIFKSETNAVENILIDSVKPRVLVTVIMVQTNEQADRLERSGLRFRQLHPKARQLLKTGAWCSVMVVDHEVALAGWLITTEHQRQVMDEAPYHVDWEHGEGVSTYVYTLPKYRRNHLRVYSVWVRAFWLAQLGFHTRRSAILKSNLTSLIGVSWYPGIKLVGDAVCTRVLGYKTMIERPIDDSVGWHKGKL